MHATRTLWHFCQPLLNPLWSHDHICDKPRQVSCVMCFFAVGRSLGPCQMSYCKRSFQLHLCQALAHLVYSQPLLSSSSWKTHLSCPSGFGPSIGHRSLTWHGIPLMFCGLVTPATHPMLYLVIHLHPHSITCSINSWLLVRCQCWHFIDPL